MKEKKQYCVSCGHENKLDSKVCTKCKADLNPKEHPLLDYLKSKIKDKYVGNIKDSAFSIIINYIKSNLYGVILTCSIVISAVSVVTNAVNNQDTYIQKVVEKPALTQKITYSGENLSALEVTEKYVKALKENDVNTIKSLQLETFYPEIYQNRQTYQFTNSQGTSLSVEPLTTHELVTNREQYFKHNRPYSYIGPNELVFAEGTFGDYKFQRYLVTLTYCYENTCEVIAGEEQYDIFLRNEVELIEVDGNYYISGEDITTYMGEDEVITHDVFMKAEGDMTKITANVIEYYYKNCPPYNCKKFIDETFKG